MPSRSVYCAAAWCSNFNGCRLDKPISFFRFPQDSARCSEWLKFALRDDLVGKRPEELKSLRLCSDHFHEDLFKKTYPRIILHSNAFPTIFVSGCETEGTSSYAANPKNIKDECKTADEVTSSYLASDTNPAYNVTNGEHNEPDMKVSSVFSVDPQHEMFYNSGSETMDSSHSSTPTLVIDDEREYAEKYINESTWLSETNVFEDFKNELCRLCAQRKSNLKPIVDADVKNDEGIPLLTKINLHLPFQIEADDALPPCICSECHENLNRWHKQYLTCIAANEALVKIFGKINEPFEEYMVQVNKKVQEEPLKDKGLLDEQTDFDSSMAIQNQEDAQSLEDGKDDTKRTSSSLEDCEDFQQFLSSFHHVTYRCKYCYEFFKQKLQRKEHIACCRELFTLCELCGKVLPRKNLARHKKVKHDNLCKSSSELCSKCGKYFCSINHHYKSHSNGQNDPKMTTTRKNSTKKYYCDLCCVAFTLLGNYQCHSRRHKNGEITRVFQIKELQEPQIIGEFSCPVCKKVFGDKLSLIVHLTKRISRRCPKCSALLRSEKAVLLHVCKLHKCQVCMKMFLHKFQLTVHERIHTGEKPFKCTKCNKMFHTCKLRNTHQLIHEASNLCSYCGKTFKSKLKFHDHIRLHEGHVFLCTICNKSYSGTQTLYKHKRKCHGKN